jgi:hypothetical protein
MKAILLATLRAAGITGLCVPLVWLVFGGVTRSRSDAPPLGLQNVEWPFVPYGTYIGVLGWALLGLIFALALLVRARRPDQPVRPGRARFLDRTLMTIGAGVLAVAIIGAVTFLGTRPIVERLVDPNCTPGMYIQRLCDDSYYPDP